MTARAISILLIFIKTINFCTNLQPLSLKRESWFRMRLLVTEKRLNI
jgi:hypothetical protein